MPHVVIVLKKVIPITSYKKATKVMWEAHKERLRAEGLTVSLEPASS